jgi:hypothetical protein
MMRGQRLKHERERILDYVISLEEVMRGGVLLAFTMAIHGVGMVATLHLSEVLKHRSGQSQSFVVGLGIIILASWLIIFTNLVEVALWASFFVAKHAQPSISVAFYNALLNYTTLQANYLPQKWHLLEGLLGMAGLITMAWSTGTLFTLVDSFQRQQLARRLKQLHATHENPAE